MFHLIYSQENATYCDIVENRPVEPEKQNLIYVESSIIKHCSSHRLRYSQQFGPRTHAKRERQDAQLAIFAINALQKYQVISQVNQEQNPGQL